MPPLFTACPEIRREVRLDQARQAAGEGFAAQPGGGQPGGLAQFVDADQVRWHGGLFYVVMRLER